jgi:hypothetical protein
MADITAAIDEVGAQSLLAAAELVPIPPNSDTATAGPFTVNYKATIAFSGGTADLIPPDTVRLANLRMDFDLDLKIVIDPPEACLPQACVDLPCIGEVCLPRICIDPPALPPIPVKLKDFVQFTVDCKLVVKLDAMNVWQVYIEIPNVPSLQLGPATQALLAALNAAITPVVAAIPLVGPILVPIVQSALAGIGIGGLTGLLGPMLTPFIQGHKFNVYSQPRVFQVLPPGGATDPAVNVTIDNVTAAVQGNGEDELVLMIDVSP